MGCKLCYAVDRLRSVQSLAASHVITPRVTRQNFASSGTFRQLFDLRLRTHVPGATFARTHNKTVMFTIIYLSLLLKSFYMYLLRCISIGIDGVLSVIPAFSYLLL